MIAARPAYRETRDRRIRARAEVRSGVGVSPRVANAIDSCLAFTPVERITMASVVEALAEELVKGAHQGMLILQGAPYQIDAQTIQRGVDGGHGKLTVRYDGYQFAISATEGEVFVNNTTAKVGDALTEGCVIAFGDRSKGAGRAFALFRQSSPQVVI